MTGLAAVLADAHAADAVKVRTELAAAEAAPAMFKPEHVEGLVERYHRHLGFAGYFGRQAEMEWLAS